MKLTEEQQRALSDADAHLALARSALKSAPSAESTHAALEIVKIRSYIKKRVRK